MKVKTTGKKMSSLKDINQRLSILEGVRSDRLDERSSVQNGFDAIRRKKEDLVMQKLDDSAKKEMNKRKVDANRLMDVISFVVDFVEEIGKYVPDIITLVGGAFLGEYKLMTAIRLITKLASDVGGLLENLLNSGLLKDMVEHTVELKFNQVKHDDGTVTTTVSKAEESSKGVKKTSKGGIFHFGLASKKDKKENSNLA